LRPITSGKVLAGQGEVLLQRRLLDAAPGQLRGKGLADPRLQTAG